MGSECSKQNWSRRGLLRSGIAGAVFGFSTPAFARRIPFDGRSIIVRAQREFALESGRRWKLERYVSSERGGEQGPPVRRRVLLLPDVMMGREAFDFRGHGLAPYLAEHGYDVTLLDGVFGDGGNGDAFGLEALTKALAELWRELAPETSGTAQASPEAPAVIAHGFTSTLAATALGSLAFAPSRMVLLSPVVSAYSTTLLLEDIFRNGGRFSQLQYSPTGAAVFDVLFTRGDNCRPRFRRAFLRHGLRDVGPRLSNELVDWMQGKEPSAAQRWNTIHTPTFALFPLLDRITPPEWGTPIRQAFADPERVRLRLLSRGDLLSEDYTRLAVLHGREVEGEVFPLLTRFLEGA